ncbi:MATE family efflux transporter [Oryzibacter oryziterrae]|uniref:MATE family efflux transporter n=1 Tax=Oryzibacter oryziterrae TaxID=2766474 RepID=UPI001F0007D0|nr:MATE family efflux transporter [Oryzibacter oryziterrae]
MSTVSSPRAAFLSGSIMRHVVVMTATGSIGLMAIFVVDVINLLYISFLGRTEYTAAMGYAGLVLFLMTSLGIGFTIAVTALCARSIGGGNRERARRLASSGLVISLVAMTLVTALMMPLLPAFLSSMGAEGATLDATLIYLWIAMPGSPLLGIGMAMTGVLRATGDARRSMYVTLGGAVTAALCDPIFIFGLHLGVEGAAIVTLISRFVMIGIGWHGVHQVHRMLQRPTVANVREDFRPLMGIAMPAILANLATPAGNIFVTAIISRFGTDAVAAWAIIGRLYPMLFGAIFALSGSVGAIFGQNFGARQFDRVRRTLADSLTFTLVYVAVVWLICVPLAPYIAMAFNASPGTSEIIVYFCRWIAPTFAFTGALFVANSAFNNLGYATYSTLFNWGRATLGTVPFCWVGYQMGSAEAVMMAWSVGAAVFGVGAVLIAYREIGKLGRHMRPAAA